jgi:membrane associated rhomboid family serine protease
MRVTLIGLGALVGLVVGVVVGLVVALAGFGFACNAECGPNADHSIYAAMTVGGLVFALFLGRLARSAYERRAARLEN